MQFSSNETGEDFSAIGYMIFADFSDFMGRLVLRMADNCCWSSIMETLTWAVLMTSVFPPK